MVLRHQDPGACPMGCPAGGRRRCPRTQALILGPYGCAFTVRCPTPRRSLVYPAKRRILANRSSRVRDGTTETSALALGEPTRNRSPEGRTRRILRPTKRQERRHGQIHSQQPADRRRTSVLTAATRGGAPRLGLAKRPAGGDERLPTGRVALVLFPPSGRRRRRTHEWVPLWTVRRRRVQVLGSSAEDD